MKIRAVEEVALFSVKGKESRIVKVKMNLNVTRVLKDRLKIAGLNNNLKKKKKKKVQTQ